MRLPRTRCLVLLALSACGGVESLEASGDTSGPPDSETREPASSTTGWDTEGASDASTSGGAAEASSDETGTSEAGGSSTGDAPPAWVWELPAGFPEPRVPEDNPMTAEKVELGRHLFYDRRLSGNETQSCADCHDQTLAFADGRALPVGSTGDTVALNSMALVNIAYNASLTWASPVFENLSEQAAVPLFGEDPVELGAHLAEAEILQRLEDDERYATLFADAYPEDDVRISWINIRRALASFQRTLISGDAPYDRYAQGEEDAISASAKRGLDLFFSERLECFHCHNSFNFTLSVVHADTVFESQPFFNTGLYNVGGTGQYPAHGEGLFRVTGNPDDMGKFRPPTLRNIALTGPYMHDGSVETLEEVIDIYAAGGRNIEEGSFAGDGRAHPNKSSFIVGFELTAEERADLVAFLESLTDESFLVDPRFANPWR